MQQVGLDGRQLGPLGQPAQQRAAQAQHGRGAAGHAVQAPQQLLPRWLDGQTQRDQRLRTRRFGVGLGPLQHGLRIGAEIAGQVVEELFELLVGQRLQAVDEVARQRHAAELAFL